MSAFLPLLRLVVGHGFFTRDPCPAIEVVPQPRSAELAARAGLLVRRRAGGAAVLRGEGDALERWAADLGPELRLDFRLESRDPRLRDYTEPGPPPAGRMVALDDRDADTPDGDGPILLGRRGPVSEEDWVEMDSERLFGALRPQDRRLPPLALVTLHLADADGRLRVPTVGPAGPEYRVRFEARRTYWRYLLLGPLAADGARVTDSDRETEFEFGGETLLPGDRRALAFRSTTPIALRERSERRFQLREEGGSASGNGRVLVNRLPVAGPDGLRREIVDGSPAFVSDIFVYV